MTRKLFVALMVCTAVGGGVHDPWTDAAAGDA